VRGGGRARGGDGAHHRGHAGKDRLVGRANETNDISGDGGGDRISATR
jgi:hypothetical protein